MSRYLMIATCFAICVPGVLLAQEDVDLESGDTEGPDTPVEEVATSGWFSNGYFRFGVGSTGGDPMAVFKLDGAETKYRLGNESDLYGEASIGYRAKLSNGSDLVGEVMLNGWADSNGLVFDVPFDEDGDVAQAYVGVERIGDGALADAFLWIGRRYYRRRDVHMTDFYYDNLSGDGVGLENLRLGAVGVSTALFYHDDKDIDYKAYTFDARVHDIALGNGWMGEIAAAYTVADGTDDTGEDGYSVRLHLENSSLPWGEMRNALQYGKGAGFDIDSTGRATATLDDNRLRFVSQALIKTSEDLETQATLVLQDSDIGGVKQRWLSAGLRPQYNFTKDWGAALELGYDWVDPDGANARTLTKITLAPFYSFGKKGFFARPQLRLFATWARWSDDGAITEQAAYANDTNGMTYGIQLEHWW